MKEVKNVEVNEAAEVEEIVKESKLKNFGSKVVTTFKKNGKKIACVAGGVGAAVLAVAVLKNRGNNEDLEDEFDADEVDEDVDTENYEVEPDEEN
jgi:hypothetical protein|nr:MAG TPA: hypothetical protein [Caudoviricetes sp.]